MFKANYLLFIARSPWYWLFLILLGLSMEGIALAYQHIWEEPPCVLCIHVRLWTAGIVLVAIAALLVRNTRLPAFVPHILSAFVMAGMFERAYQLLGIERGTIMGDCSFNLGLPDWLAIDKWFPALFEVETTCGYTPELLFGITMAEALIVMSAGLFLVSLILTVASFPRSNT